jgi:hypothetical protein
VTVRPSLRLRAALSFALFSMALVVSLVAAVLVFTDDQEDDLIRGVLESEIRHIRETLRTDPHGIPSLSDAFGAYLVRGPADREALPPYLRSVGPGESEVEVGEIEYHVRVEAQDGIEIYLAYDVTRHERKLRAFRDFLFAAVGLASLLSAWLGFALAGRIVGPVLDLARQVRRLAPDAPHTTFAESYRDREVLQLAEAFDAYHRRVAAAIARETAFTATVSHELRTPLTAIQTGTELLSQETGLSAKGRQRATTILRAAERMAGAIESLLLLARETPADGVQAVALEPLVREAVAAVADELREGVDLVIAVPPDASVSTYPTALHLTLVNLLRNAAAHTAAGRIEVSSDGSALVIRDTGGGIPPADQPYVFDRFYRGANARTSGSGLGLAIVRQMADRFGWRVVIESGPGEGTEVRILFPPTSPKLHSS